MRGVEQGTGATAVTGVKRLKQQGELICLNDIIMNGKYGTSFIKWSQVCQRSVRTHKRITYLSVALCGQQKKVLV